MGKWSKSLSWISFDFGKSEETYCTLLICRNMRLVSRRLWSRLSSTRPCCIQRFASAVRSRRVFCDRAGRCWFRSCIRDATSLGLRGQTSSGNDTRLWYRWQRERGLRRRRRRRRRRWRRQQPKREQRWARLWQSESTICQITHSNEKRGYCSSRLLHSMPYCAAILHFVPLEEDFRPLLPAIRWRWWLSTWPWPGRSATVGRRGIQLLGCLPIGQDRRPGGGGWLWQHSKVASRVSSSSEESNR